MIEIINRQRKHRIRNKTFKDLLEGLSARYGIEDPELALVFVGLKAIRTLNRKYMKKDKPTDVLSFPLSEKGADGRFYLGDIVISVPVARAQSRKNGHSLERELKILTIHGFLHLIGLHHSEGMGKEEESARREFLS